MAQAPRQPYQPNPGQTPQTIQQGVQQVQAPAQQLTGQQAPPLGATQVNQQTVVQPSGAMLGLVNSLAEAEMLKTGTQMQSEGRAMMYAPGGGKKDNWRNALAGSIRSHRGRKKVDQAMAMEQQALEKAELDKAAKAKAAAQFMMVQTGSQEQADATYEMVMAGMPMPEIPKPEPHAGFDVRDKIYDDSKDTLKGIYKTQTAMEVLNTMVEKGYESGVAQIGAMYSFIKGIDPESVVRPSETDLVGLAESYIQQMKNIVDRVDQGVVTSEAVFNDLAELTGKLTEVQVAGARRAMDDHIGRAAVEGYTPDRIWGENFAERYALGPPEAEKPKPTSGRPAQGGGATPSRSVEEILAEAEAVLIEAKGNG